MCATDLTPVHAVLGTGTICGLSLGDVCDFLSKVEVSILLTVYTLDFDETSMVILVSKVALVAEDGSVDIQTDGGTGLLFRHFTNQHKRK